jgi:cytochrome c5
MRAQFASLFTIVILLSTFGWAAKYSTNSADRPKAPDLVENARPPVDEGERVFTTHCRRCHTPPMSLPPRITGTIIMHMRERARLSRGDEQLLLRYLAP